MTFANRSTRLGARCSRSSVIRARTASPSCRSTSRSRESFMETSASPAPATPGAAEASPQTLRLAVTPLPQSLPRGSAMKPRQINPLLTEAIQPASLLPEPPRQSPDPQPSKTLETVLALAGYAISARALLLLALIGAFVLALLAITGETLMRLYVLIAYCLLVVAPVVALEIRKR